MHPAPGEGGGASDGVGDKMSAKQADRQQRDEPPHDPEGALYKPSEAGPVHGQTHGFGAS